MDFQIDEALEVLTDTPQILDSMLRSKSAVWLECKKTPESFSAVDVLGHLMLAELTDWMPRVRFLLEHGDSAPFDPFDRFAFKPLIAGKTIGELLNEFARLRQESLASLRSLELTEAQLQTPGRHPDLGPVTLRNLLATWAVHDLGHIAQIVKTMANEYRDAVGPWQAYTTILH